MLLEYISCLRNFKLYQILPEFFNEFIFIKCIMYIFNYYFLFMYLLTKFHISATDGHKHIFEGYVESSSIRIFQNIFTLILMMGT